MAEFTQEKITAADFAQLPETTTPTQLIDGEIIVSPSPKTPHQRAVLRLVMLITRLTDTGEVFIAPMDVHLDDKNVVQPDVFWVRGEGSACILKNDGYWYGAPDLVIEVISPSSLRMDKVTKFNLYEQHGVAEYWLADLETHLLEVWVRGDDGKYTRQGAYTDSFESVLLGEVTVDLVGLFG